MQPLLQKVYEADLLTDDFRQAVRDGLVYICMPKRQIEWDELCKMVFDYVARIDHCAAPTYAHSIHHLWERILDSLPHDYFRMEKGKHAGQINKYRIQLIIQRLSNKGVYSTEYDALALDHILENSNRKSIYYKGAGNYSLFRSEYNIIDNIVAEERFA